MPLASRWVVERLSLQWRPKSLYLRSLALEPARRTQQWAIIVLER